MIKTIIFDLSEVYLHGLWGVENILEKKIKISSQEILDYIFHSQEFTKLLEGKISENKYWGDILKISKWNLNKEEMKKIVRDHFKEIMGTREIIEQLKKQGFQMGLLSDHCREWIEYCEKEYDYHKLFNSTLYSFEIEMTKSNKETFQKMLNSLKANPKECLFIDDSTKNIKNAKEIGINTILFKNPEQLKKELLSFKIKI